MMMRKLRWLAVVVPSLVLGACSYPQICPDAGGGPVDTKCFYYETITAKNPETKEVRSTVAESVVKEDQSHLFNFLEGEHFKFNTNIYQVQDSDFSKLEVNKSYMLVTGQGELRPRLCTEPECTKAIEKFRPFEPDEPKKR